MPCSARRKSTCRSATITLKEILPKEIFFVTTSELEEMFGQHTERTGIFHCQNKGAVCVMQIGGALSSDGKPHDGRAPDYDGS